MEDRSWLLTRFILDHSDYKRRHPGMATAGVIRPTAWGVILEGNHHGQVSKGRREGQEDQPQTLSTPQWEKMDVTREEFTPNPHPPAVEDDQMNGPLESAMVTPDAPLEDGMDYSGPP